MRKVGRLRSDWELSDTVKDVVDGCKVSVFFFFKQKTAYEIGTGDWSSDVCSSDLSGLYRLGLTAARAKDVFAKLRALLPHRETPVLCTHLDRKSVV